MASPTACIASSSTGTLWHQISEVEAKAHKARGEDTIFDILESSRHAEGSALCRQMAWAEVERPPTFHPLASQPIVSHVHGMPKRRAKTPAELKEDMQNFDRACTREFNKAMVRLAERLLTPPKGQRRPPLYKVKLPRITKTIVE
jgi:hypothetical protein